MLDLSGIKTRLESEAGALAQVVLPDLEDVRGPDSATEILALVDTVVSSRTYPVILPDDITYPAAVYELVESQRTTIDGYPILRTDSYLISLLHGTYGTLAGLAKTLQGTLQDYSPASAAGTIDIINQDGSAYDEDLELHAWTIQADITHLAQTTQSLPAAYVYSTGEAFFESEAISCVSGTAESYFSVLLVDKMPATGISGLSTTRTQILAALAGYAPSGWSEIRPSGGDVSRISSKLVAWRDNFATTQERIY